MSAKPLLLPTLREHVVGALKECYDPEIPFNIVDLGLIYSLQAGREGNLDIKMTLTSPGCPVGPWLSDEITRACMGVPGVKSVNIEIIFEPPWRREMMSEQAHEALGF